MSVLRSTLLEVPATSANLGPGFDCLGVALGEYLRVQFDPSNELRLTGKGRVRSPRDSLIYRSFSAAFEAAGQSCPPVSIDVQQLYPSARGLGASASAIVAGLEGARKTAGLNLDDAQIARLAIEIEGHADNVLPALFGGAVLTVGGEWTRFDPTPKLAPLVLVAGQSFKTEAARKAIPERVLVADAVQNVAASATLVAILASGIPMRLLMEATRDALHEPYRLPHMPESELLHRKLREEGIATTLSGAGPSLICLVPTDQLDTAIKTASALVPDSWSILTPGWNLQGVGTKLL